MNQGRKAGNGNAGSHDRPVLNRAAVAELWAVGEEFFDRLLAEYEQIQKACVADMGKLAAQNKSDALRKLAHKLKGAALNLGASALAQSCEKLELQGAALSRDERKKAIEEIRQQSDQALYALKTFRTEAKL